VRLPVDRRITIRIPVVPALLAGVIFLIALAGMLLFLGSPVADFLGRKESRGVFAVSEGIEDLTRLDCAVYRIRAVYPYDFPGLEPDPAISLKRYEFCVLSARVRAGYDLEGMALPELQGRTVKLDLGEPRITAFILDDDPVSPDAFPDFSASPEEWRLIVEQVTPFIEQMALDHGIMEEAGLFARDYLTRLYRGAGYDRVLFSE
jgi:hypothetical protein